MTNKTLTAVGTHFGILREPNPQPSGPSTAPDKSVPPVVARFDQVQPRWKLAVSIALGVFLLGFGAEYLFWVSKSWAPSDPGLFGYRAAAIGDSLLLPTLAALLVLAIDYLPAPAKRERAWSGFAALLGFLVGLGVQISWLADTAPQLNWTLPEPHHFNVAGYWHAGFFIAAASLFGGLTCLVGRRLRCNTSADDLVVVGWSAAVSMALGSFMALVILDNFESANTTSSASTVLSVIVAGVVVLAGGIWAFWHCRHLSVGISICRGLLGAAGFVGAVLWGFEGLGSAQAVASIVAVAASTFALCAPGAARSVNPSQRASKFTQFIIVGSVLAGTLSLGLELVGPHTALAAGAAVLGSVIAVAVSSSGSRVGWQTTLTSFAVTLTIGLIVLSGWLTSHPNSTDAGFSLGFAVFFLEALVIALIRERYEELKISNASATGQPESASEARLRKALGDEAFAQVVGYGLAALIGLLILHVTAGNYLSVDDRAGALSVDWVLALLSGGLSAALAVASFVVARSHRQLGSQLGNGEALRVDVSAAVLGLAALGIWSAAIGSQMTGVLHYPVAAGAGAAWLGAMTAEDVIRTGARVHLHSPGVGTYLFACAAGLTVAVSTMWLLSVGIWSESAPGTMLSAAISAVCMPVVTGVIVALASSPVAYGIRCNWLTPQSTVSNFLMSRMLYAMLGLLALSIPFFAIGRIESLHPPHAALVVVTGLAMIPSFIGVFVWILNNNRQHVEDEKNRIPADIERFRTVPDNQWPARRDELVADRLAWLKAHVVFQYQTSVTLTIAGGVWLAVHLVI